MKLGIYGLVLGKGGAVTHVVRLIVDEQALIRASLVVRNFAVCHFGRLGVFISHSRAEENCEQKPERSQRSRFRVSATGACTRHVCEPFVTSRPVRR